MRCIKMKGKEIKEAVWLAEEGLSLVVQASDGSALFWEKRWLDAEGEEGEFQLSPTIVNAIGSKDLNPLLIWLRVTGRRIPKQVALNRSKDKNMAKNGLFFEIYDET